jgi:hypothetical protein
MPRKPEDAGTAPKSGDIDVGSPSEQAVPYQLRMRAALKETLEQVAEQNSRSLNSEITYRLETSLADEARRARLEPALEDFMELARIAFIRGGTLSARAQGIAEAPERWLVDPVAFRAAIYQMADALEKVAPPVESGPDLKALLDINIARLADGAKTAMRVINDLNELVQRQKGK